MMDERMDGVLDTTNIIAKRVARELKSGNFVNLGIGIPSRVANFLEEGQEVYFHSENGVISPGAVLDTQDDLSLINASGHPVKENLETSYVDSLLSFSLIRGGHLDVTVLGALEVDQEGSIANWIVPGRLSPGMGGAMDLLCATPKIIAALKHLDKTGKSKILKKCTLPLTAYKKLTLIITDKAVMQVTEEGLLLKEIVKGLELSDLISMTEAKLIIPDNIAVFS